MLNQKTSLPRRFMPLRTVALSSAMLWVALFLYTVMPGIARAQETSMPASADQNAPPPGRAGDVPPASDYTTELTSILDQIVTRDGMVRYDLLSGPLMEDFRRVVRAVEEYDVRTLTTDDRKLAFWMNAYNVQMLWNIITNPETSQIIEDGYSEEFFNTPIRAAGLGITLDQIEHVLLRRQEGPPHLERLRVRLLDPRIHVGINCAAVSCPALRSRAFTPSNVDEELDRAMREFMGRSRHVRMEDTVLVISSILDWFGTDFEVEGRPLGDFLVRYMPKDRDDYAEIRARLEGKNAAELKHVRFEYDWSVNRAAAGR